MSLEPIVSAIKRVQSRVEKSPRFVWATVVEVDPLHVWVDGDEQPLAASPALATLPPRVGSRVYCVMQNGRATVVGAPDIAASAEVPLETIADFVAGTAVGEATARVSDEYVWFAFNADITPGASGHLLTFQPGFRPPVRTAIPLIRGTTATGATVYATNGGVYSQYPPTTARETFRASGMFARAT